MLEHGLVGRGVANHARAVGLYPRPSLERLAGLVKRAGLGFVSDPHTGPLHLPVRELTAMGVPVALGQDDIEDAYYPFGRHNLLEIAFLAAHALEAVDTAGIDLVYDAVTTTAARVLGVDGHHLEVGGNADLVVHHHATLREVLAHHAAPAHVIASGRLVASTTSATTFHIEQGVLDMTENRRIRIGIDTGGTFTDVVAFDEDSGELVTTKTPSTPSNPADGFLAGIDKVLGLIGADGSAIDAVSHGTTVATNQLLEGKVDRLGFLTTEGYEAMLEIARQSVPDGYGNSYFWVKPDRIVPRDRVKGVGGRLDFTGAEVRPFDEESARTAARWFKAQGINTLGVCFLHAYANPEHEERMRAILDEEHPDAVVSLSSQVLREYREYERAMTTLVDAAVKPRLSAYVNNIKSRLTAYDDRTIPFYVMKSNGGVLSADEVVHQPITTVLSGPAAGALGAALIAKVAGFDRVLTSDGGGTSTDVSVVIDGEPTLTTEGSVGAFPSKIPMIDVVTVGAGGGSIAWLSPEGTLKVGPQSAGADPGPLCYGKGGTDVTITDAHVYLGRIPPHLLGGEIPLDVRGREGRRRAARRQARPDARRPAPPASWRSRPGTRPTRCARSPSSAASTSATSRSPRSAARARCCCAG